MDMASLIVEEHILQEALKAGLAKDAAKYHSGATPARGLQGLHGNIGPAEPHLWLGKGIECVLLWLRLCSWAAKLHAG